MHRPETLRTLGLRLGRMQGPWSQYRALSMHCEELPCFFDRPGRDDNSTDLVFSRYSDEVL